MLYQAVRAKDLEMVPSAHVLRLYPDVRVYSTKRPRSEYVCGHFVPKSCADISPQNSEIWI